MFGWMRKADEKNTKMGALSLLLLQPYDHYMESLAVLNVMAQRTLMIYPSFTEAALTGLDAWHGIVVGIFKQGGHPLGVDACDLDGRSGH